MSRNTSSRNTSSSDLQVMASEMFPGVAVITGAGSGIGRACAISFAREGCKAIAMADTNFDGIGETGRLIHALGPDAEDVETYHEEVDVSNPSHVKDFMKNVAAHFGRIDYAVNAAGCLGPVKTSHEMTIDEFDKILNVDYRGLWLCSREELKHMIAQNPLPTHDGRQGNRGSIVNIASQLGIVARPNAPAYCSAKSAVIGLTKSDAIDYSKYNIRVNCVCPGVIDTPMVGPAIRPAIAVAPMKRAGTAQEVADCVLFLCSSKATFCQGSALVVDGGYTIN